MIDVSYPTPDQVLRRVGCELRDRSTLRETRAAVRRRVRQERNGKRDDRHRFRRRGDASSGSRHSVSPAGTGFSVYANGYASFLAGQFRARYFQGQAFDPSVVDAEWEAGRLVPILDFEAGVGWTGMNGKVQPQRWLPCQCLVQYRDDAGIRRRDSDKRLPRSLFVDVV